MFKKTKPVRVVETPVEDVVESVVPDQRSAPEPVAAAPVAATAVYEVADFAALDEQDVAALAQQADDDAAAGMSGCAHLVVTQDLSTGVVNHHVPVGSGREALALAAQIVAEKRAGEAGRPFTVTVTPLLPHSL